MLNSSNSSNDHQTHQTPNPFHHLMDSIFSYDGNVMLAAIICLLLVILFVLVLHVYAKWFLAHANHRRHRSSMTVSTVRGSNQFHHFPTFAFDITNISSSPTKGLDPSIISSIPLFVYKVEENKQGLECVICLSGFEENETGRNLPKCSHTFHVQCIDMWLGSHSNCPICRAPVVCESKVDSNNANSTEVVGVSGVEVNGNPDSEIVIDVTGSEDDVENLIVNDSCRLGSSSSSCSCSSSSSSSSFGCSLKRMFSKSWSENRLFPASSVQNNEVAA